MRISAGLESIRNPIAACSVAIGVFDGVHRGHQALIRNAVADAHAAEHESVVLTFDRHPAELIAPDRAPEYISTPDQQRALFAEMEVDHLVIARFDERFRDLSPESFLRLVVIGVLGAAAVFVGSDFRFGCEQAGDAAYLREAQERLGFKLHVLEPVLSGGERVSSTRIRDLIRSGDLVSAREALGHPFLLTGTVVEGARLGRTLGYPTANLVPTTRQVVPANGIYACRVFVDGRTCRAATSIGLRPTVSDDVERTIEAFLLDFDGDLYGRTLDVEFVARLRDEERFDSLTELVRQIADDVSEVERLLPEG